MPTSFCASGATCALLASGTALNNAAGQQQHGQPRRRSARRGVPHLALAFTLHPTPTASTSSTSHLQQLPWASMTCSLAAATAAAQKPRPGALLFASVHHYSAPGHTDAIVQRIADEEQQEAGDVPPATKAWLQEQLLRLPFMRGVREQRERIRQEQELEARRERQRYEEAESERLELLQQEAEGAAGDHASLALDTLDTQSMQAQKKQGRAQRAVRAVWKWITGFRSRRGRTRQMSGSAAAEARPPVREPPVDIDRVDRDLWVAFAEMDRNNDGHIDFVELRAALERLGLPCTPEYLLSMMQEYDMDGDNTIDWQEFRYYVHRRETEIEKAFRTFDIDGNGEISAKELGAVLRKAGIPANETSVRGMMKRVDEDSNASISYDEFRRFAAFLPSVEQLNSNPLLYAAFWSATVANPEGGNPTTLTAGVNNEATVGAGTGSSYVTSRYGPAKHFVFFDISIRLSLAVSLLAILSGFTSDS